MNPDEAAALFDARAERYAADAWHRPYAERLVAATPLKEGDVVLDAGMGLLDRCVFPAWISCTAPFT